MQMVIFIAMLLMLLFSILVLFKDRFYSSIIAYGAIFLSQYVFSISNIYILGYGILVSILVLSEKFYPKLLVSVPKRFISFLLIGGLVGIVLDLLIYKTIFLLIFLFVIELIYYLKYRELFHLNNLILEYFRFSIILLAIEQTLFFMI